MIFVENKGPWYIVGPMLRACVYHVTGMSTLLMLCQNTIHEPSYVKDAIRSLHLLDVQRRVSLYVKLVIGRVMAPLHWLHIRGRRLIVILVALQLLSFLQYGHSSKTSLQEVNLLANRS